ncbi:hypothetical protein TIFTF001_030069 [Ficus carica]|uniref:Methyltransferase type 11 domain-containing protein n=1 Tax=Ficus carica TaxID=3494 RepID=A0AA88J380_FICCA|nr:hypothetical protein TIFTF001_030069 [Ficus carica]
MSISEVEQKIAPKSSLDLVTAAQALHWLDLPSFYQQVKWVLKKPHGVIAAWCYTEPKVNSAVDAVFQPFYANDSWPFWDSKKAKDKGFELLRNNVIERLECAWSEDGNVQKVVKFPVHLKIGRVGNI